MVNGNFSPGVVQDTLYLSNNTLLSGNSPSALDFSSDGSNAVAFDTSNNYLYATSQGGSFVSVVNSSTNKLVKDIPLNGGFTSGIVFDPSNGFIYVCFSFSVVVLNGTNNSVASSIATSGSATSIAFDASNGYLYAAGGASVTVINGANDSIVTSISLAPSGNSARDISYDPGNGELYVTDSATHNVTVIDGATNSIKTVIHLGSTSNGIAYDSTTKEIYVADRNGNISAIDGTTNTIVSNITAMAGAYAFAWSLAFDPANNLLAATDSISATSGYLLAINVTSNTLVTSLPVAMSSGTVEGIVYNPNNGDVYVSSLTSAFISNSVNEALTLTEVNLSKVVIVSTIDVSSTGLFSQQMAYDPLNGEIFVTGTLGVTIFNGSSDKIVNNVSLNRSPSLVVYNSAGNDIYAFCAGSGGSLRGIVFVISAVNNTLLGFFPGPSYPGGVAYDSGNGLLYSTSMTLGSTNNSGNLVIIDGSTNSVSGVIDLGGPFTPSSVAYDPSNGYLYVPGLVNSTTGNVTVFDPATNTIVTNVTVGVGLAGAVYDPSNGYLYVVSPATDIISVLDGASNTVINSIYVPPNTAQGLAFDTANNALYGIANSVDVFALNSSTNSTQLVGWQIYTASDATSLLYDPSNGIVFVDFIATGLVYALNVSSNPIVSTIPLESYPQSSCYDPVNNNLYVTDPAGNQLYVIDASTNSIVSNITVGMGPTSVIYDQANGFLYVYCYSPLSIPASSYAFELAVINPNTGRLIDSISLPAQSKPGQVVLDTSNNELFVGNTLGNYVTVVNTSLNRVTAKIPAGSGPEGLAYDPSSGELFVANSLNGNVSVINGTTNKVVANLTIGLGAVAMTYDSSNGYIYAANSNDGNVSVINGSSNSIVTSISVTGSDYMQGFTFDPTNGYLYLTQTTTSPADLNVINGSSNKVIASIALDYGASSVLFDQGNSLLYVSNSFSGTMSTLSSPQEYVATFTESGLPSGTAWFVNLTNGQSFAGTTASISFNESNGSYTYSIVSANSTYSSPGGSFTVNGASVLQSITFAEVTYSASFTESGLPSGTTWYVNLTNGQSFSSTTATVAFSEPNGTFTYSVATTNKSFSAPGGSFTISGKAVTKSLAFTAVTYGVTFTESGLPLGTTWYVNISGQQSLSSTTQAINAALTNGTHAYSVATTNKSFSATGGYVTVNGAAVSQPVTFTLVTYSVTLNETGLPTGTTWYVNLTNGQSFSSAASAITFSEGNGTYTYSVATTNKTYSAGGGSFTVSGGPASASVTFTKYSYVVTMTESGLPSGTTWYVNLTGGQSFHGTSSTITFSEPNGTYAYTIATTNKEYSSPGGSLVVNGASVSRSVTFTQVIYQVSVTETGLPSGATWYVNLSSGQSFHGTSSTITFSEPNGTYTYSIATSDKSYTAPGGSLTVSGYATTVSVTFNPVLYTVTFTESGLTSGATWFVTLNGVTVTSTTGTITFNETNGTYPFTAGSYIGYYVSPSSGSLTVNGAPVSQAIAFNESMFLVTFTESGLPSGTTWYVNISGGPSLSSSSAEITATLSNGTYTYSVGTTDKLFESVGGTFIVNGAQLNRTVTFTRVTYSVTFTESGLPSGTTWYVNLTSGQSFSSTSTSISFNEPNGSYTYVIGTSFREYSAKGGSFSVAGSTESLSVAFSIVDYNLTFTESGLPSGTDWSVVVNGANVTLAQQNITFSLPNGTYQFTVVPPGGYTTQTVTGTVTVHGSSVSKAISFTSARSSPPPGNSPTGIFGGTLIIIVILAGVVIVIAAVAVVFVRMRRKV